MTTAKRQDDAQRQQSDTVESLRLEVEALRRTIAEQTTLLATLESSERRFRRIVENTTVGILVAQDDAVAYANDSLLEVSGYSREELGAFSFAEFVHPDDRQLVLGRYLRRLQGEALDPTYVFKALNKTGEIRYIQTTSILVDWDNRPATLSFLRDVTAERQLEADLNRARRMEAVGTLTSGIAHDFNNILASVLGFNQLALEELGPDHEVGTLLERVKKSAKRAKALVERMLSYSKPAAEERQTVRLDELIRSNEELLRASLPSTIDIQLRLASESNTIFADPVQIDQVLINLCANAQHAMREQGGTLTISLEPVEVTSALASTIPDLTAGPHVVLTVADTGAGMDPYTMERIFDPFFTTKESGEGTGLGLTVTHGIVKRHGGAISVSSAPGQETAFVVYFPRFPEDAVPAEAEPPLVVHTGTERVLYVDDEPALVELGKLLLERVGYKVETCTSANDALHLFQESAERFDLVIADMTMPGLTGDKLAQELLRIRPDIPIILLTGHSEQLDREQALSLGVKGYHRKPIGIPELTRTIREALGETPSAEE